MKYFKNKKVIINLSIIVIVLSSMFAISFLFDYKIKKEAQNLEYNRFLDELSTLIKNIEFDELKENIAKNRFEAFKNDKIVSLVYIEEGKGISGIYKIAIIYEKKDHNNYIINNFKVIEYESKDEAYIEKVENDTDFRNSIINKRITEFENVDVVSGATISSNEINKAIKTSIEKILNGENNE